jgi:XTP/dITP diphosphohydrolase
VRLVLASANPDKAAEIRTLLFPHELLARPSEAGEVAETGTTLLDNARIKARAVTEVAGLPAVADDTGLEVRALGGAPGVSTARFAGHGATYRDNVEKLLGLLGGVADRTARFRTVALVAWPDGSEVVADGVVEGRIAEEPHGAGGFGYDPVFVPDEGDGSTFAEMAEDQKHAISHRGRAFRRLSELLDREERLRDG